MIRNVVKSVVKVAYGIVDSMTFPVQMIVYQEDEDGHDPYNPTSKGNKITYHAKAVESYSFNDDSPVPNGERLIYIDYDTLPDVALNGDCVIKNEVYRVERFQVIQQDVLWEIHLTKGG